MKHKSTVSGKSGKESLYLFLIFLLFAVKCTGTEKIFCDKLEIRPLTENMLLIRGSCRSFYAQTFRKRYGRRLEKLGKNPFTRRYVLEMEYRACVMDLVREFRARICEVWRKNSSWTMYDPGGKKIPVELIGFYWIPSGYLLDFLPVEVAQYHIEYHVILKSGKALSPGQYILHGPFGSREHFHPDPSSQASALLHVRDLSDTAAAARFAIGAFWSGSGKKLDLIGFEGKIFEVICSRTGRTVHRGKVFVHTKDPRSGRGNMPLQGSMTLTMDLTPVRKEGCYFLRIPSLGRSQDFRITAQAGSRQGKLYLSALKALRCRYCHKQTARGNYPGEALSYRKSPRSVLRGFFTPSGESFSTKISTFLYAGEMKEFPLIPGLYGGWHEDPSGRKLPAHLETVNALLSVVLYQPRNPGAEPLLEEALYGLDLYRRVQTGSGGVGLRIEPSPHRCGELLLSAPGRRGTLQYAQSAALASLVLRERGFHEQSNIYLQSALKAWSFALERKNRLTGSYRSVRKNRVVLLQYYEDPELDPVRLLECAAALYHASGEKRFLHIAEQALPRIRQVLRDIPGKISFWDLAVFLREKLPNYHLAELYDRINLCFLERAAQLLPEYPGVEKGLVEDLLAECSILTGAWLISGKETYYRAAWQKALVLSGLNVANRDLILSGSVRGTPDRTQEITRVWGLYFPSDQRRKKESFALSLLTHSGSLSRREHTKKVNETVPMYFRNISVESYSRRRSGEDSFVSRLGTAAALFYLLHGDRILKKSVKK